MSNKKNINDLLQEIDQIMVRQLTEIRLEDILINKKNIESRNFEAIYLKK